MKQANLVVSVSWPKDSAPEGNGRSVERPLSLVRPPLSALVARYQAAHADVGACPFGLLGGEVGFDEVGTL